MTQPEGQTKPETNAPPFTDQSAQSAVREIARLNGLLEERQNETTRLQQRVQELEGQVDETKQAEFQKAIDDLKAENERLKGETAAQAAAAQAKAQSEALAGKVRDPDAALRLLTDDLKDKDGQPDVEKILAKYPYLAPEGTTTATAPSGAGGVQNPVPTNLDTAVASKDIAAINAAFDEALKGGK